MPRGSVLLAGALAMLAGCRVCELAPPVRPVAPELAAIDRGRIEPDVSALPTTPSKPPARPAKYRKLTVADCRVLATANAPLAADLDLHPANDEPAHPFTHHRGEFAHLSRQVRGF